MNKLYNPVSIDTDSIQFRAARSSQFFKLVGQMASQIERWRSDRISTIDLYAERINENLKEFPDSCKTAEESCWYNEYLDAVAAEAAAQMFFEYLEKLCK